MLVFILFPTIGQVFLWLDGSCNYSFTLLFQLLFIYLILNINKKNYLLYLFISILAGMCNENSSLSLIVFLLLYIINNRDNLKVKIVSLVGLIMGYLFLFLAPGNYVRMETVSGQVSFFNHFFVDEIIIEVDISNISSIKINLLLGFIEFDTNILPFNEFGKIFFSFYSKTFRSTISCFSTFRCICSKKSDRL